MVYLRINDFCHRLNPDTRQVESCEVEGDNPNHKWRLIDGREMEMDGSMKSELRLTLERLRREFPQGYKLPRSQSLREMV